VQQWPEGPDPGSFAAAGPSEQRAAERSADERSEAEAQKSPTIQHLVHSND